MGIFKDFHVYLAEDAVEDVERVKDILRQEEGSLEYYCTELVDVVVCDQSTAADNIFPEGDSSPPVIVFSQWILLSQKCGSSLPTEPFLIKNRGIFDGLTFCPSKLCRKDQDRLWSMVVCNGGRWQQRLDRKCTHLLTMDVHSSKYKWVQDREECGVRVVTPDWIPDCIESGELVNEADYCPSLLPPPTVAPQDTGNPSSQEQNGKEKEGIVVHRENSTTPDQPPSVLHLPTTSDKELQGGISCVIRTDGTIIDLGTSKTVVLPPTVCSEGERTVEMDTQETTVKAYSILSTTAVGDSSFSVDKEQVQVRQGEGTGTTGGTQERVPNPCLLEGMVFFIADYDRTMTSHIIEKWNEVITDHGGEVLKEYDGQRCTHLIAKNSRSAVFDQAFGDRKCIASAYWLNDVLTEGVLFHPKSPLHFPVAFVERPAQGLHKDYCLCWTNYVGTKRQMLKDAIKLAGFSYTGFLSKRTTHLLCQQPEGVKYESAREWGIPVLNSTFITDILYEGSIPEVHPYHMDLNISDDLSPNHPYCLMILNSWKHRSAQGHGQSILNTDLQDSHRKRLHDNSTTAGGAPDTKRPKTNSSAIASSQEESRSPSVIFTGFTMSSVRQLAQVVESLGGAVVGSVDKATHIVAQKISRTVKFLSGLCHCQYVLSGSWVDACSTAGEFVDEDQYILKDPDSELLYDINLKTSLEKARRRKLFEGLCLYSTSSVVPEYSTLRIIVECAGGRLLTLDEVTMEYCALFEGTAKMADMERPLVVICRDNDFEVNCNEMQKFFKARIPMYTPELVFTGILHQEYLFAQCRILPPDCFVHSTQL